LLLTGSSDFKARVFSAWIKSVDDKTPPATAFGDKIGFGDVLAEYQIACWVHYVCWSPSGNRFAFVGHDSTATFVDVSGGAPGDVQTVRLAFLPLASIMFTNEDTAIACGHDCLPLVLSNSGGQWAFSNLIQMKKDAGETKTGGTKAAFELFKNKVEVGANTNVQSLSTLHQNCITCVHSFEKSGNEDFSKSITRWVLRERGVLQLVEAQHHKVSDSSISTSPNNTKGYRISDLIDFSVVLLEWNGKEWVGLKSNVVQMEFVRLDPYLRLFMHQSKEKGGVEGRYELRFQAPDVYGVFTMKVLHDSRGYSKVKWEETVVVRPFRHDEYERFIVAAFPYYASALSMIVGFFLFSFFFLYHRSSPSSSSSHGSKKDD